MGWFSLLVLSFQPLLLASQSLPLLLVVSFDGFRWDYPKLHGPLSNFSRLEQRGVRAHSMTPTFTTATAPNHYTLITGLYEYVHGLVSDQIYDPRTKEVFQSSADLPSRWWPVTPIWTVNEQRAGARSGVLGWPHGSVGGVSKSEPYSKGRSFTDMVDQMLRWFTDAAEPINFGAIYFPEPSITGRQYGPHSNEMKSTIRRCDEYLGYLLNEIDKNDKLKNNLHLIVTSDHGMEQVNSTVKPMCLEDFVDVNKIKAFGTETVLNIFVNSPDDINSTFRSLNQIPHSSTHKKNDIPDRYNYRSHPHIGDLIVIVNPGYELYRCSSDASSKDSWRATHGNYGYDNQIDSMKTIFYGRGPELKENFTLSTTASLYNVDVFGLMCSLLNIDACPPSNGSAAHTLPLLIDSSRAASMSGKEPERLHDGPIGLVIYLLVLVSFVLILIMAVTWSTVAFRNASAMARAAHGDPTTIAEQNQYKFTQINDRKLHPTIGDDNL